MFAVINSSLSIGVFPNAYKHAMVHLLVKKPILDPTVLLIFMPI